MEPKTDMGNVSLALPSIHPMIGINSVPATNHLPEYATHCATPRGRTGARGWCPGDGQGCRDL